MRKKRISEERRTEIVKLYNSGVSMSGIHKKLGNNPITIKKILLEHGVEIRQACSWFRAYKSDESVFEKIDTGEKAYWLGFLYADGCITKQNTINLLLSIKDISHLKKFKKFMKSTNPIKERFDKVSIRDKSWEQGSCNIRISSKKIIKDLERLGCGRRKTNFLKWPSENQVPKEFIFDFIRGWFDGDGSIWITKKRDKIGLSVTGTDDMCESFSRVLRDHGINSAVYSHSTGKGISIVAVSSLGGIAGLCEMIYNNKGISFLERKFEKYIEIKKVIMSKSFKKWEKDCLVVKKYISKIISKGDTFSIKDAVDDTGVNPSRCRNCIIGLLSEGFIKKEDDKKMGKSGFKSICYGKR